MKTFEPTYVRMCSRDNCDAIRFRYFANLELYGATEADCEMVELVPAPPWDTFARSTWRLNINTYLGWKVYMLLTGCFASKPEYETV